jgi:hypothetical protein
MLSAGEEVQPPAVISALTPAGRKAVEKLVLRGPCRGDAPHEADIEGGTSAAEWGLRRSIVSTFMCGSTYATFGMTLTTLSGSCMHYLPARQNRQHCRTYK